MTHEETCLCTKRTIAFRSDFKGDAVTKIYCPDCVGDAPGEALIFELCEPGEFAGVWGVRYNAGELKRLDPHFRDEDDYYLSLLISGVCGPEIARQYKKTGLCRILGFMHGPSRDKQESTLSGKGHVIADDEKPTKWPGDVIAGPKESPRRSRRRR